MNRIAFVLIMLSRRSLPRRVRASAANSPDRSPTRSRAASRTATGSPRRARAKKARGRRPPAPTWRDKPIVSASAGYYAHQSRRPSSRFPQPDGTRRGRVSRHSRQLHVAPVVSVADLHRRAASTPSSGRRSPRPRRPAPTSRRRAPTCGSRSSAPTGRRSPRGRPSACSRNPPRGPKRSCPTRANASTSA